LHPGWLGDFNAFEGDLDLSLHIWPSSGPAVMSFLGRRIGELSSTIRIIDEEGGRPDPLRRAALKDALEPQDRIAGRLGKSLRRLALPDGQSPFTGP
jgi:hypothetical protein